MDHAGADNKKDHDRDGENRDADGRNPKGRESGMCSRKRFDIFLNSPLPHLSFIIHIF